MGLHEVGNDTMGPELTMRVGAFGGYLLPKVRRPEDCCGQGHVVVEGKK